MSPGTGYEDLTAVLAAAAKGGMLPYYPDDLHWSPSGHRIAAEAIEAYLAAHP
jgi:lysophospholipase L1-like esterase